MSTPSPSPHPRPPSTNTSKRRSIQPSRSYHTPSPGKPVSPSKVRRADGLMGGLRERSEEALREAGGDELREGLREEWREREKMTLLLNEKEESEKSLLAKHEEQVLLISSLETRLNEVLHDQARMEDNLASHETIIEKLRAQLKSVEKEKKDIDRRYIEQERSFEAERQSFRAEEAHLLSLLSRPHTLSRAPSIASIHLAIPSASTPPSPLPKTSEIPGDAILELQEDLATSRSEIQRLETAHSHAQTTITLLSSELHELKSLTARLEDENSQWELLLRERTLDGGMSFGDQREEGLMGLGLGAIDEEGEGDGGREKWKMTGRRNERMSLADELAGFGGVEEEAEGAEGDVKALKAEVKSARAELTKLQDSNKALSMYCEKIIDRIIGTEGFEHVLSNDYDSPKKAALNTRRGFPKPQRPSLVPAMQAFKEAEEVGVNRGVEAKRESGEKERNRKDGVENVDSGGEEATTQRKKANRSSMMDWRSIGGSLGGLLGGSTSPAQSSSSKAPTPILIPAPTLPAAAQKAESPRVERRLYEEDDEDKVERARLKTTLKLMGIDNSEKARLELAAAATVPEPPTRPRSPLRRSNTSTSARSSTTSSRISVAGPLSRLSSLLGGGKPSSSSPLSPEIEKLDPWEPVTEDAAAAVLKAFDKREKEQAALVRKGKGGALTSPSPDLAETIVDRRRASASQRRASGSEGNGSVRETFERRLSDGPDAPGHVANKASVSTLWSIGGTSVGGASASPDPDNGTEDKHD